MKTERIECPNKYYRSSSNLFGHILRVFPRTCPGERFIEKKKKQVVRKSTNQKCSGSDKTENIILRGKSYLMSVFQNKYIYICSTKRAVATEMRRVEERRRRIDDLIVFGKCNGGFFSAPRVIYVLIGRVPYAVFFFTFGNSARFFSYRVNRTGFFLRFERVQRHSKRT